MKPRNVLWIALWIALASGKGASAQIAGELTGRIVDRSGAGVSNAQIVLTASSTDLHQNTATTSSGDYIFFNLSPGAYQIDVAATGFQHLTRTGITVMTGQTVTANLTLTIGADQQSVTVSGDLPLLQSATSNIQTNIPASRRRRHAAQHAQLRAARHARPRH